MSFHKGSFSKAKIVLSENNFVFLRKFLNNKHYYIKKKRTDTVAGPLELMVEGFLISG